MKLTFLGAAQQVTGSCFLLETESSRVLVDHGMFQGGNDADRKNRARLPFDPRQLTCVLLTHAHIDHSGLLPRLASMGFRSPIYTTPATVDLLGVMLPDAAYLQERDAQRGHDAHTLSPLYTLEDAHSALGLLRSVQYGEMLQIAPDVECRFRDAGHILGSAIIEVWCRHAGRPRKIVFSGDIGQKGRPIVNDPTPIEDADYVLVESTYGNRLHKSMAETEEELVRVFQDVSGSRRGNIVIPAFAVGRTQEILHVLTDLLHRGRIGNELTVYVDSPMASRATEVTLRHRRIADDETRALLEWQQHAGDAGLHVRFTESVEESKRLNAVHDGAVIISASGMCDAGRIRHHLKHNLPRPECSVVFTGFQAEGTLGRRLVEGARSVRLFGEETPVRAKIWTIGGLSAHADQAGLIDWLKGFRHPPQCAFVVHGESSSARDFAAAVRQRLGWTVEVPRQGDSRALDLGGPR